MKDSKQEKVVCKLKIIFEKLLDLKIKSLDDLVFDKTKNWDSLKHLQILVNVEKEFTKKIINRYLIISNQLN
jgi:acyl carrier protein|tara:strand:+ start:907 stop:1122 length:216 start_codon:yes stop_codon:yes gene_type:complete